jgi:hypothetical protein
MLCLLAILSKDDSSLTAVIDLFKRQLYQNNSIFRILKSKKSIYTNGALKTLKICDGDANIYLFIMSVQSRSRKYRYNKTYLL